MWHNFTKFKELGCCSFLVLTIYYSTVVFTYLSGLLLLLLSIELMWRKRRENEFFCAMFELKRCEFAPFM